MSHSPHTSLGTALVTGASTGIGAVYADRLARRGYDLILTARDGARLEALAERLRAATGRSIDVIPADLTIETDTAKLERRLADDPAVTLLVNNAGMALSGDFFEAEPEALERIVTLNITAPTRLAAAAGKAFLARGGGAIVNLASIVALSPERLDAPYSGSKSYMLGLSLNLAHNYGAKGLYVQAVLPGATRTEIWDRAGYDVDGFPPEIVMHVDDLVDAALVGFDKRETVTIPPLQDERLWTAMNDARLAMADKLSVREPAPRYRETVAA